MPLSRSNRRRARGDMATAHCPHLRKIGWDEWECDVTGASVESNCGTAGLELFDDGISMCFPRAALQYNAGTLDLGRYTEDDKEVIMRVASEISGNGGGFDLEKVGIEDLDRVIKAAQQRKRQLSKAKHSLPRLRIYRDALGQQAAALRAKIEQCDAAIAALEEGRQPDAMPNLQGFKAPKDAVAGEKPKRPAWTPERRAAQAERIRRTHAARRAKIATAGAIA